jgi:hypothetical protein
MQIVVLQETGQIDIPATRAAYLAHGQPRRRLLAHLLAKIRAVCPDLDQEEVKTQTRLAANAIFVATHERPLPRRHKGLRLR